MSVDLMLPAAEKIVLVLERGDPALWQDALRHEGCSNAATLLFGRTPFAMR
jgi:hypothetical protein